MPERSNRRKWSGQVARGSGNPVRRHIQYRRRCQEKRDKRFVVRPIYIDGVLPVMRGASARPEWSA